MIAVSYVPFQSFFPSGFVYGVDGEVGIIADNFCGVKPEWMMMQKFKKCFTDSIVISSAIFNKNK